MKQLILLILFHAICFSQNIQSDKIDEFDGSRKLKVGIEKPKALFKELIINQSGFAAGFDINFIKSKSSDLIYINFYFDSNPTIRCYNESKIIFLFEDGSKTTLNQISKLDCGRILNIQYRLEDYDITQFMNSKIKKVRIFTTEGYLEYDIKENKKQKIIDTFVLFKLNL